MKPTLNVFSKKLRMMLDEPLPHPRGWMMSKLFTGYTVVSERDIPYYMDDEGVLWDPSERQPPAIFKNRRSALEAATRTLVYGMKHKLVWSCHEYRIQGVRNA